jgi:hypothetical protein
MALWKNKMKLRKIIRDEIMNILKESNMDILDIIESGSHPIITRTFVPPTTGDGEDESDLAHMTYEELVRAAGVTLEMALNKKWDRATLIKSIKKWEGK